MAAFRVPDLRAALDAQWAGTREWLAALSDVEWSRPSALAGWSVAELAVHIGAAVRACTDAVAAPPPSGTPLSIAEYVESWPARADDIAQRERHAAAGLAASQIKENLDGEWRALASTLDDVSGDVVIAARRGSIRLSDFLATRVNELVVHTDDLARSLPEREPPAMARRAVGVACRMLTGVLAERAPGHTVELRVPPHAAVQCVEGPRHTRGTPPNVVEADPLTWIRLACGRITWQQALDGGKLAASGERADLTAWLPLL